MSVPLPELFARADSIRHSLETMSREEISTALRELIDAFLQLPDPEADARVCHALGHCHYLLPGGDPDETERWLRRALELNPAHHHARLLLGHHLFDQDCYKAAGEQFRAIPAGAFAAHGQPWLDLKVREMALCCDIYRHPEQLSPDQAGPVMRDYLAAAETSPADPPQPIQLIRAIVWAVLSVALPPPAAEVARQCSALISRLGLQDRFASEAAILDRLSA